MTRRFVFRWRGLAPRLVLIGLCWLAVGRTADNYFVGDDFRIRYETDTLPPFWTELSDLFSRPYYGNPEYGLYRPLFMATVWIPTAIVGYRNARIPHLINIALHATVTLMFFAFARRLPQPFSPSSRRPWMSGPFLAAALFAVHPIHIEPVSQMVGRAEILAALFSLGALILHQRNAHWTWGVLLYALGLLSKESSVVLPVLLAAHDLAVERRLRWGRYLALAIPLTFWLALRRAVLGDSLLSSSIFHHTTPIDRLLFVPITYFLYLKFLFWPIRLTYDYSDLFLRWWEHRPLLWASWIPFSAWIAVWIRRAVRHPGDPATLGLTLFSLGIALFVHVLPLQFHMADRFAYLASLGFCLFLAAWLERANRGQSWVGAAAVVMAALGIALARAHSPVYTNTYTALKDGIHERPDSLFLNRKWVRYLRRHKDLPEYAEVERYSRKLKELNGLYGSR